MRGRSEEGRLSDERTSAPQLSGRLFSALATYRTKCRRASLGAGRCGRTRRRRWRGLGVPVWPSGSREPRRPAGARAGRCGGPVWPATRRRRWRGLGRAGVAERGAGSRGGGPAPGRAGVAGRCGGPVWRPPPAPLARLGACRCAEREPGSRGGGPAPGRPVWRAGVAGHPPAPLARLGACRGGPAPGRRGGGPAPGRTGPGRRAGCRARRRGPTGRGGARVDRPTGAARPRDRPD